MSEFDDDFDLQLPRPLLDPSVWLARATKNPILSAAHFSMGGPIDQLWDLGARAGRLRMAVPVHFWSVCAGAEPSLGAVARVHLESLSVPIEILGRGVISDSEKEAWLSAAHSSAPLSFKVESNLREITPLDWSREVFPEGFRVAGEIVWRREFQAYEKEMAATFVSMDQLRFWPGYVKAKKLSFATLVASEWAHASALFSPQNDQQGAGEVALLNPTLQVSEGVEALTAVWRIDGKIKKRPLNWQEATVIDELRETPRIAFTQLETELAAKPLPFKESPDFKKILIALTTEGVILKRKS